MTTFAIIQMVLNILEPALAAAGVIPTPYAPLAAGILAAVAAVKQELSSANGTTLSVNAITLMAAISSGLRRA